MGRRSSRIFHPDWNVRAIGGLFTKGIGISVHERPNVARRGRLGVVAFILTFIQFLLIAVWALVLGRMLISWVDPAGRSRASVFLIQATEPILAPVRRLLPQTGMIDWSGFLVLIILGFLWRAF